MSKKKTRIIVFIAILFSIFLLYNNIIYADNAVDEVSDQGIVPSGCQGEARVSECGIPQMIETIIKVYNVILGILGSVALFFFVYGGFVWLLSRGNTQMIEKGKSILIGAIIGLVLVLASWIIVNLTINILTGKNLGETGTIFNEEWNKIKNK